MKRNLGEILPTTFVIITLLFMGSVPAGGADFEVVSATSPEDLQSLVQPPKDSNFPTWLGADAATSIRVDDSTYVWLFGDTLIGKSEGGRRKYSVFIHNTIGVSQKMEGGDFGRIEKYWREDDGKILPIFPCQEKEKFYWPLVGARLNNSLVIAADKVTTEDTETFKTLGTTLFTMSNPEKPPTEWNYFSNFLPEEGGVTWGSALLVHDGWLYVFGEKGAGFGSKSTLGRLKVGEAEAGNWDRLRVWSEGDWKVGGTPTPVPGLPGTSETTVDHNSFLGWYSLRIPPLGYGVHLYTAGGLTGPWKDQGKVYSVPSPWSSEETDKGKNLFSAYAVKSHPELAQNEDEIVITYNVNLNPFVSGLTGKMGQYIGQEKYEGLYVPQFVLIELQRSPEQG